MADRIIREAECQRVSGLGRTTRYELEIKGQFPKRRRLTGNSVGWIESEIQKWIEDRAAMPAPAPRQALEARRAQRLA